MVSASLTLAAPAQAAPSAGSIDRVRDRIESLQRKAETATEDYLEAKETLRSTRIRVRAARERVRQQRHQVALTRASLGRLAAQVYQQGELSTLEVALGDDPDHLLARAGLTSTVIERQDDLVRQLQVEKGKLEEAATSVARQVEAADTQEARLGRLKSDIERQIRAATVQLDQLETAQRAAVLRASRSSTRTTPGDVEDAPVAAGGGGTTVSCGGVQVGAPSARVATVLRFACAQLGDPYRWAGSGPDSWDCSGFTRGSWAAAGVSLPHSSRLQYGYGRHVSRDSLQAGDLVFFYSPISHVGIYLGNGLMIHAPNSGDVVRVAAVHDGFVGATRL